MNVTIGLESIKFVYSVFSFQEKEIMYKICLVLCTLVWVVSPIETPPVKIEAFLPRGIRVSIPAERGISLFAFHGNVNKEIGSHDAGEMSGDVRGIRNNRFSFENNRTLINVNIIINNQIQLK